MRILVLDSETNGVDPKVNTVIEIAVVLYDCIHAAPVSTFATLIEAPSNEAAHINKIPAALLAEAMAAEVAWARVEELAKAADCFVAHNAPFDKRFTPEDIADMLPWICSQRDIEWPELGENQKLPTVAIAHGIAVIGAHRALTDVDLLVRIFQRLTERGHDVPQMLRDAMASKPTFEAIVSYENREIAKSKGFSWNKPMKRWEKRMTVEAAKKLPFKTRVVDTPSPA